jgi:hypothetical protein
VLRTASMNPSVPMRTRMGDALSPAPLALQCGQGRDAEPLGCALFLRERSAPSVRPREASQPAPPGGPGPPRSRSATRRPRHFEDHVAHRRRSVLIFRHGKIEAATTPMALSWLGRAGHHAGRVRETDEPSTRPSIEAGAGTAPTVDSLTGTWFREGHALFVSFTDDGRFAADPTRDALDASPYGAGTYEIEGNTIRFVFDATAVCTKGDESAWTVSQPEPNRLEVNVTEDGSGDCRWGVGEHRFVRLSDS